MLAACLQNPFMLGTTLVQSASVARRQRETIALGCFPQWPNETDEPSRPRRTVEREMKVCVCVKGFERGALPIRGNVTCECRLGASGVLGIEAAGGVPDRSWLERKAGLVDLTKIGDRQAGDVRSSVGYVLNQTYFVEAPECLAHRHRAHAQAGCEILDRKTLTRQQNARDDSLVQSCERTLGKRPMPARRSLQFRELDCELTQPPARAPRSPPRKI